MIKPIRIFYSELSGRLYASQHYKELSPGNFEVTGVKEDVTSQIGAIVHTYKLKFRKVRS